MLESAGRVNNCSKIVKDFEMKISRTEVNLRRLLAAVAQQEKDSKLIHYVATSRELLEQLGEERIAEGFPRVSKAKLIEYSDLIDGIASKITASACKSDDQSNEGTHMENLEENLSALTLRRRTHAITCSGDSSNPVLLDPIAKDYRDEHRDRTNVTRGVDSSSTVLLDDDARGHIDKHRKLQDDLTEEMIGLAQQLKQTSLMMKGSLQTTEKVLESTGVAIENSLGQTRQANRRTMEVSSTSFRTTCFTFLLMFLMALLFLMVVLLIRIT